MKNNKELKAIVKGCKNMDKRAQQRLFEKYKNLMFTICKRYSHSDFEAEDMMMEGWIRIFQNIDSYKDTGSFEAWMKRVMINNAINMYKANLKHNHVVRDHIEKGNHEAFETDMEFSEDELIDLIQKLPNSLRLLFNLSAIEGYSNGEISEMLGQTPNSVKSNLYKAKKILRDELNRMKTERDEKYR